MNDDVSFKAELIAQLRSKKVRDTRIAIQELSDRYWLYDGSLEEANLVGGNLYEANFRSADVTGVDFSETNLAWANFISANCHRAKFCRASMGSALLVDANMEEADFTYAYLPGATLVGDASNAMFNKANLRNAVLKGDFRGAQFENANFKGATIEGDLRGANLTGAKLRGATLEGGLFDESTILPDGRFWQSNAPTPPFARAIINPLTCNLVAGLSVFICVSLTVIGIYRYLDSAPPPFAYNSEDVQAVCELFELDDTDAFCKDPENRGPRSLEFMLERKFPLDQADYSAIMPYLSSLPMQPYGCFGSDEDRLMDVCPSPLDCTSSKNPTYDCYVTFPGEIRLVKVEFSESTELITRYLAESPPGS